jgi:hypothetical protein
MAEFSKLQRKYFLITLIAIGCAIPLSVLYASQSDWSYPLLWAGTSILLTTLYIGLDLGARLGLLFISPSYRSNFTKILLASLGLWSVIFLLLGACFKFTTPFGPHVWLMPAGGFLAFVALGLILRVSGGERR